MKKSSSLGYKGCPVVAIAELSEASTDGSHCQLTPWASPASFLPQKQVGGISDFWYDVAGWVTLVALGFGIATLSRGPTALPPAPAR